MQSKQEFKIDDSILTHLSQSDIPLANLIHKVGDYTLNLRTDYFASLVRAIIGQQLSAKAAASIWRKMNESCEIIKPDSILTMEDEELRSIGLSRGKINYVRDLCQKVLSGQIDFEKLREAENEDVIKSLVQVKGIGPWTAEMFLIFSLGRLDILPVDDLGIRRAVKWLYVLEDLPDAKWLKTQGERWRPYRTVACLYLWEVINRGMVGEENI